MISLMSAPIWALNVERGSQRLTLMAAEMQQQKQGGRLAMEDDDVEPRRTADEQANYWRDHCIASGLYPYYINPNGNVVQSLDPNWDELLQPGAVAVVPFNGIVVKECTSWEEVWWGLVSSARITAFQKHLLTEDRVAAMVKVYHSPGGMVDGTENLGKSSMALSAAKPTIAYVNSLAASAGYWDASQHGEIILDGRTSEVGSVGVMATLWDMIPLLESWGLKIWELYADESSKKNEGWRGLTKEKDPALYKKELSYLAGIFHEVVKSGRGERLGNDPAALEGRVYPGQLAIDAGLADGFGTLEECIAKVRPATVTKQVPVNNEKNPTPVELGNDDTNNDDENAHTNTPNPVMKFAQQVTALIAGLFSSKETATAENIAATNTQLQEKGIEGVMVISTEEHAALSAHEATIAAANTRATEAEARATQLTNELGTATATIATITSERDAARAETAERTTQLETAQARITTLEGEVATDDQPEGAVNKKGDTKAGSKMNDDEKAFAEAAEEDLKRKQR